MREREREVFAVVQVAVLTGDEILKKNNGAGDT
jgi:hypothetical protein